MLNPLNVVAPGAVLLLAALFLWRGYHSPDDRVWNVLGALGWIALAFSMGTNGIATLIVSSVALVFLVACFVVRGRTPEKRETV